MKKENKSHGVQKQSAKNLYNELYYEEKRENKKNYESEPFRHNNAVSISIIHTYSLYQYLSS